MNESRSTTRTALTIAAIYTVTGSLWILLSDKAVEAAFSSPEAIIRVSMLKGWFYIGVTALLLFGLIRYYMARLASALAREVAHRHEVQRANELLTNIIENSNDAIYAKDLAGKYLVLNAAAGRIAGHTVTDLLGKSAAEVFAPETATTLERDDALVLASGQPQTSQHTYESPHGRLTILTTKGPLRDRDGHTFGIFGLARDITQALQTERALMESEERLRLLIQNSPAALAMFDQDMRYLAVSDRWLRDFDLTGQHIVGKSHYEVFPELNETLKAIHQRGLAGESLAADEDRFVRTNGTVQWLRWEMLPWHSPNGEVGGIVIFAEDITDRKAAEETLRGITNDLETTIQAIPDLMFEVDREGRYLSVRATRAELLAAPSEQLLGRTVTEMLPPAAAQTILAALDTAARTGSDYGRTITLPLPHGVQHFEISVARKPAVEGQALHFVILSRDITARMATEEQLRQRNEELERFNRATVGREMDLLEMKKTINALSQELGREPPYPLAFMANADGSAMP